MIQTDYPLTPIDDSERRRILAKVYELLIRLAEEVESTEGALDPVLVVEGMDAREEPQQVSTDDLAGTEEPLNSSSGEREPDISTAP